LIDELLKKRLIINIGKGGVGKSAFSAAVALYACRKGKKVLLVQLDAKDKISEYLGVPQITDKTREVIPNLFAVNTDPRSAMREYVLLQVRLEAIYKMVFENRFVSPFLRAVPALSDLVMLGKVEYHVNQTNPDGTPYYDSVIVDSPPTGHGMFFLSVPDVMAAAAGSGPIMTHCNRISQLLKDKDRTAVNIVTLPEEMPVSEAIDAHSYLTKKLDITPFWLVINRFMQTAFLEEDEAVIASLECGYNAYDPMLVALKAARAEIKRRSTRYGHVLKLIQTLDMPYLALPDLTCVRFGALEVNELCETLKKN